jgi:hypothetical protein
VLKHQIKMLLQESDRGLMEFEEPVPDNKDELRMQVFKLKASLREIRMEKDLFEQRVKLLQDKGMRQS